MVRPQLVDIKPENFKEKTQLQGMEGDKVKEDG